MADKFLHVHDRELGYVPRPGVRGHVRDGGPVTIEGDGFRFSGHAPLSAEPPLLAVGDSFTYGEDVGDLQAWPAQLQQLLGRRVLNGGVSGYGLDQIVLRTERLAALHGAPLTVVSFIADDIRRTEMRRLWWHDKPWFCLEDEQLVLQGVPVPDRKMGPSKIRNELQKLLIALPPALQHVTGYSVRVHRSGVGAGISLRLIERLADLQNRQSTRILLVAQYDAHAWLGASHAEEQRRVLRPLLDCAKRNGIDTIDTFHRLAAEPRPHELYGPLHMNARGNLMIAGLIAARLRRGEA